MTRIERPVESSEESQQNDERPPARETAATILAMPVVRYPAAVAAGLAVVGCVSDFWDHRWLGLAVNVPIVLFLVALASGALARLSDSGRVAVPDDHDDRQKVRDEPVLKPQASSLSIQTRKIERDKALYAISAILAKRSEREGSSHEIWSTEIVDFEAYIAQRFAQMKEMAPADLRAKVINADRDASAHRDYKEALAQQFVWILEGKG